MGKRNHSFNGRNGINGRNNFVASQMKHVAEVISRVTPEIYACFAITLKRNGWDNEQIEELFTVTQELWFECQENDVDIRQWCLEETGIDMKSRVEEEREMKAVQNDRG